MLVQSMVSILINFNPRSREGNDVCVCVCISIHVPARGTTAIIYKFQLIHNMDTNYFSQQFILFLLFSIHSL